MLKHRKESCATDGHIRIAFIASMLGTGGSERQWLELIKGMDKNKFKITLICLYDLGEVGAEIERLGIHCYHNIVKYKFSFSAIFALAKILKEEKIKVAFLMRDPLTMFYGVIASKLAKIRKIIIAIHCTGYFKTIIRDFLTDIFFLRFVNKVVCVGTKHKAYLIGHKHFPPQKLITIFNGVDVAKFEIEVDKGAKKRELQIQQYHKIVGIVARLFPTKRHDVFLDAARIVLRRFPKVTFLIVGEGESRLKIEQMIISLGMAENIRMLGTRHDIPEINKILDVSVLSSDPIVETLPMTIIEAMASSVPVVATEVGSVPDLITDGENGFLIPPGDSSKLAEKIISILEDDDLAHRMGQRAHDTVCARFTSRGMVENYEKLFLI